MFPEMCIVYIATIYFGFWKTRLSFSNNNFLILRFFLVLIIIITEVYRGSLHYKKFVWGAKKVCLIKV
jgi:hypothetical protein